MNLEYLIFDFTDEESGRGSFDAMASVLPARVPALIAEIETVLGWARNAFGPPAELGDGCEWDYELQAVQDDAGCAEASHALHAVYDERTGLVSLTPVDPQHRVTLTLTLGGSPTFCNAFREAFSAAD